MDAVAESRLRARPVLALAALLAQLLPIAALAQDAAIPTPPELRWLLSPRLPADAVAAPPSARPPGLPAGATADPLAPHERHTQLTLVSGQREPEPLGYFSIKDPCAQEHLNRNDEPLSQRIDCQGLGIPSGWFHPSNAGIRHPR